ncbi:MAG TPA: sensor histidine kinase [Propionibacteriaceae bacterium]|nr:sensor histidine kinase [Propionibacteriaceae bacterium]
MRVVARRALLIDSVVGFALAITSWMASSYVWGRSEFSRPEWRHGPPRHMIASVDPSPWVLPAVTLLALGVATRRIWPRAAFIATVVGVGTYLATGSTFAPIFLGPVLAVYSMAGGASISADRAPTGAPGPALPPLRSWAPLLVLLVPTIMAGYWQEPYLGLLDPAFYGGLLSVIAIAVVPAMIALLVRSRRESEREVREQERRRYAYEERLRIARDVHDVVGHSLAVITMQAGVALHLLDKERTAHPRPDQVASSLEAIKKTSREALAELRTTLEVFRADAEEPRSPLPGLDRLDDLIEGLRSAGRDVALIREQSGDDLQEVPAAVDQAAFRIIQESLTNIVRHAPAAHATVRLTHQAGTLTIEVDDDGPAVSVPPDGNGIRGMRERARAVGGAVRVSVREPSGLAVRADLPLVEGKTR